MAETEIVWEQDKIYALLHGSDGPVATDMLSRGKRVESGAKRRVHVDTGRLRASITTQLIRTDEGPGARVGTNVEYATYHHQGTGIYGPRGAPIFPVNGRFLVFQSRRAGRLVFARKVSGSKPNPFLLDALADAS